MPVSLSMPNVCSRTTGRHPHQLLTFDLTLLSPQTSTSVFPHTTAVYISAQPLGRTRCCFWTHPACLVPGSPPNQDEHVLATCFLLTSTLIYNSLTVVDAQQFDTLRYVVLFSAFFFFWVYIAPSSSPSANIIFCVLHLPLPSQLFSSCSLLSCLVLSCLTRNNYSVSHRLLSRHVESVDPSLKPTLLWLARDFFCLLRVSNSPDQAHAFW